MKRIDSESPARRQSAAPRPDAMDAAKLYVLSDVAAFLAARGETIDADARVVGEFAEFLAGGSAPASRSALDAAFDFKESLRRRIWRIHLLAQPRRSSDSH